MEETSIAVFPLRGALLLPEARLPLHIFEARYRNMVRDALAGDGRIGMIQPQPSVTDDAVEEPPLYDIGCVGEIEQHERMDDGRYVIILRGVTRFRALEELEGQEGYRRLRIALAPDSDDDAVEGEDIDRLLEALIAAASASNLEVEVDRLRELPAKTLVNTLPVVLPFGPEEKQALLEAESTGQRLELLIALLAMGFGGSEDPGEVH